MSSLEPEELLRALFDAAVSAAHPEAGMRHYLPEPPKGRVIVVGAGKASAAMARALEEMWLERHHGVPLEGLVVTRYGHGLACSQIEVVEASHPIPDAAGEEAARRILALVQGLTQDDLVIALISGGGSALLPLAAPGLTLADKQAVNAALLRSGAPIEAMNCVRKHLSAIKGGRLAAAAAPARVVSFVVSDVPGDDLSSIASGPTVCDATTFADALAVLTTYGINEPHAVIEHLHQAHDESIKPDDVRLARCQTHIVASPQVSLEAAAALARAHHITPLILGDSLEGEARELGVMMAGIARQVVAYQQPAARPCVLLSGGETTVSVKGSGRGGRNVEFLLALTIKLAGMADVYALACDTDGIDGLEPVAGAIVGPHSLTRARALGLDAHDFLERNDAHSFFEGIGAQVVTGPTRTNVNDFRAILIV